MEENKMVVDEYWPTYNMMTEEEYEAYCDYMNGKIDEARDK